MENQHHRLERLQRLYEDVFAGRTDAIPLIVTPPCGSGPDRREFVSDTRNAMLKAADALAPKVEADTDWIPSVNTSWYQCIVVPSLFGAEPVELDGSEPIVRPVFSSALDAARAGVPEVKGRVVDEMRRTLEHALEALPASFHLSFPATASPFDLAQLLLPADEFLLSLMTHQGEVRRFLDHLTELCLQVFELVRGRLRGTQSEFVTNRGLHFPGLRLPCDAIVNLSPGLLREFVLPVLQRFGERYGKLCTHFCTQPAPSRHVLPVLTECEHLAAVDNWQGPDVFLGEEAPARLQPSVAVITDVDLTTDEKMDAFLSWEPIRSVPRQGGRGIVVTTSAPSVLEAKRIYEEWSSRQSGAVCP